MAISLALDFIQAVHAGEPHTSPRLWSEPRLFHSGAPPAELANRVHLQIEQSPTPAGDNAIAVRNPDTSLEGPWRARVTLPLKDGRALELRLENVAGPVTPRRIGDSLVFVRVPWGRVAFSDLLIETRHGELIFHELLLDGRIAFEQHQEALAHPDLAETPRHLGEPPSTP